MSLVLDGHKLLWHRDRVEAWLRGERIAPITIDMALTRSCNYHCEFCYAALQENTIKKMTEKVIFDFLDDAADIGVKAVSFVSDGESTLSPHLYGAILRGYQNGLDMALGTAGYLLKKERLEEILPALTYLRFNFSAGEPKRYAEIHGKRKDGSVERCFEDYFHVVCATIRECVAIKKRKNLKVTLGLQMVLMPHYQDQILPLAKLGRELGVDYLVIKHCSDDEFGSLGVDYSKYHGLIETLEEAELYSTADYFVKAKWSKILSGGKRRYSRCHGTAFMMQLSGSGLVAPCGMLFNDRYKDKFHIGNITEKRFKEIWQSEDYWKVIRFLSSDEFDAKTMCGSLCLQHKVNEYLDDLKQGVIQLKGPTGNPPEHINFI